MDKIKRFPTIVIIPTKYAIDHLLNLLERIKLDDIDQIVILDNGHTKENWARIYNWGQKNIWLEIFKVPTMTIYEMWNWGWKYAKGYAGLHIGVNVAFLNDDIDIWPDSISEMAHFLRSTPGLAAVSLDPNRTETMPYVQIVDTTAGAGGMAGFAFMIKGELPIPFIDENLKLYWGDDDLVKQIRHAGYEVGVIRGLPVEHAGSLTIRQMDSEQRRRIMEQDRLYFNQKYNEHREPVW